MIDFCFKFSCKGLTILHSDFHVEEQAHLSDLISFIIIIVICHITTLIFLTKLVSKASSRCQT